MTSRVNNLLDVTLSQKKRQNLTRPLFTVAALQTTMLISITLTHLSITSASQRSSANGTPSTGDWKKLEDTDLSITAGEFVSFDQLLQRSFTLS